MLSALLNEKAVCDPPPEPPLPPPDDVVVGVNWLVDTAAPTALVPLRKKLIPYSPAIDRSTSANLTFNRTWVCGGGVVTCSRLTGFPRVLAMVTARSAAVKSLTVPRRKGVLFSYINSTSWPLSSSFNCRRTASTRLGFAVTRTSNSTRPPPCSQRIRLVSPSLLPLISSSLGDTATNSMMSGNATEARWIFMGLTTIFDRPTVSVRWRTAISAACGSFSATAVAGAWACAAVGKNTAAAAHTASVQRAARISLCTVLCILFVLKYRLGAVCAIDHFEDERSFFL